MKVEKIAQLTGHKASIYSLAKGFGNAEILSVGGDGWIVKWDIHNPDIGELLAQVDEKLFSICSLGKQRKAVVGNMDGGVHWIDLDNPTQTKNVAHHKKGVFDIKQVKGAVLTAGGEGVLTRWSVEECRTMESYHLANQSIRSVEYCESRNEIAVGASDNSIYLLDADSLELKHRIETAHENSVFSLSYFPASGRLLSGGRDAILNVWDVENGFAKIESIPAHMYTINDIAFHPKGHIFATASRDKTIKIWDAASLRLLKVMEGGRDAGHLNSVNKLLWDQDSSILASCSDDRTIILWKVEA